MPFRRPVAAFPPGYFRTADSGGSLGTLGVVNADIPQLLDDFGVLGVLGHGPDPEDVAHALIISVID